MSDSEHEASLPISPVLENGDESADAKQGASEEHDTPPAPTVNADLDVNDEDNKEDDSDNESELSEVDEAEFAEFDPTTVALEDRPQIGIDEDIARTLKASKRKRAGDDKKPKEAKREKKKRPRHDDDDDEDPDGEMLDGKRRPKRSKPSRGDGEGREKVRERRPATPENEDNLTPEERRRRSLDKAMDAALKNPNKRRRKKDEVVSRFGCI